MPSSLLQKHSPKPEEPPEPSFASSLEVHTLGAYTVSTAAACTDQKRSLWSCKVTVLRSLRIDELEGAEQILQVIALNGELPSREEAHAQGLKLGSEWLCDHPDAGS